MDKAKPEAECCANCKNCVAYPKNNRYGDVDYMCLISGYYICLLYTSGRTLECSSLPRPSWRYGATAERACEQEKGVTGCWKDVTAVALLEEDRRMYKGMMFTPEAGKTVNDAEAFEYAKNHLDELPQEDKELFVEFFFSDNWIKEEDHAETI